MDLERLIQRLEADTSQFQTALQQARGEITGLDQATTRATGTMQTRFAAAGRAIVSFRGILASLGVALSVRQVLGYAEAYTRVQNNLRVAGVSTEALTGRIRSLCALDWAAPVSS